MQNGKGDCPRPIGNRKQFDKNWDSINWGPKKKRELKTFSEEEYIKLLKSGMMFEFYPDATGNYKEDCL